MEDRKEYSVVGKVEIGTDEYRDLIEDKFKAEKQSDYYMREGWKKDEQIRKLNEEVDKLKERLDKYKELLAKSKEPINEDSISAFMNVIFGED